MFVASVLDSLQDVSSIAIAAAAFVVLFLLARGLRSRMSGAEVLGLVIAPALLAYLLIALRAPGEVLR